MPDEGKRSNGGEGAGNQNALSALASEREGTKTEAVDPECPHGLDARWCSICLHGVSKPEPAATIEATFFARFDGHCRGCDLPIAKGQVIHKLSNDTYRHEGCQP